MRQLGSHDFFKLVNMSLKRYHSYLIAARFLLLQYGLERFNAFSDIGPDRLYSFFDEHKDLDFNSREFLNAKGNLDYIQQAFRVEGEQIPQLSSEVWIINLYLLSAILRKSYAMRGKEATLVDFYKKFYGEAENLKREKIKPVLNNISNEFIIANSSGTGSKENLEIRKKELLTNFLAQTQGLEILDPNRLFTEYEKIAIYEKGKVAGVARCTVCQRSVMWNEFEADHIRPWSQGGKTIFDNAQLLCRDCNRAKGAKS